MSSNRLSLNSAKTQLIWFGTPQQLLKLDHALLSDRFPHFTFHNTVRDLGVTLDSAFTFSQHISKLTRSSYFQLRRLRTIRKAVSVHVSVPIFTSMYLFLFLPPLYMHFSAPGLAIVILY